MARKNPPANDQADVAKKPTRKVAPVTAPVVEDGPKLLKWKKLGGGSLRLKNRIIKPGETFFAALEDIPKAFLDSLECLDGKAAKKIAETKITKEEKAPETSVYALVENEDHTWNVLNPEGKVINEQPLTETAAQDLKLALEN
jgi:hypothetical protein